MLDRWNDRPILPLAPDLVIETDTSLLGWSSHETDGHRRPLDRAGESSPHKSPGASWRSPGHEDIHEGQGKHPRPPQDGQHDGHSIHQQDGRYKVPDSILGSLRPVALVPPARDNPVSSTPPGCAEFHGRRRVQDATIVSRVDARDVNLSQRHTDPGLLLSGSLRHSSQQPTGELAPRPVCDSNGCL